MPFNELSKELIFVRVKWMGVEPQKDTNKALSISGIEFCDLL